MHHVLSAAVAVRVQPQRTQKVDGGKRLSDEEIFGKINALCRIEIEVSVGEKGWGKRNLENRVQVYTCTLVPGEIDRIATPHSPHRSPSARQTPSLPQGAC